MRLILAADIFGRTQALDELAGALAPLAAETVIIDPYEGEAFDFESEEQAYAWFRQHTGVDRYAQTVGRAVAPGTGPVLMVGFSVGAAAIWMAAAEMNPRPEAGALCFYGSQIRHKQALNPAIEVEMFFPREEPHFDVAALSLSMSEKNRVTCHATAYLHGFMNRRSINFDPAGFDIYMAEIKQRLGTIG